VSKQALQDRAAALLALHVPGDPVILPTVWDAWSAKLAVEAGFAALTLGEGMSFDDLTDCVAQIAGAVDVPISVDIESGYGEPPQRLIDGLLSAGAVGLNIEDVVHGRASGYAPPRSTQRWWGSCARRPTPPTCTW
jgi:2-methylisocitrate lyase-like PEP mutase family enzyme